MSPFLITKYRPAQSIQQRMSAAKQPRSPSVQPDRYAYVHCECISLQPLCQSFSYRIYCFAYNSRSVFISGIFSRIISVFFVTSQRLPRQKTLLIHSGYAIMYQEKACRMNLYRMTAVLPENAGRAAVLSSAGFREGREPFKTSHGRAPDGAVYQAVTPHAQEYPAFSENGPRISIRQSAENDKSPAFSYYYGERILCHCFSLPATVPYAA